METSMEAKARRFYAFSDAYDEKKRKEKENGKEEKLEKEERIEAEAAKHSSEEPMRNRKEITCERSPHPSERAMPSRGFSVEEGEDIDIYEDGKVTATATQPMRNRKRPTFGEKKGWKSGYTANLEKRRTDIVKKKKKRKIKKGESERKERRERKKEKKREKVYRCSVCTQKHPKTALCLEDGRPGMEDEPGQAYRILVSLLRISYLCRM